MTRVLQTDHDVVRVARPDRDRLSYLVSFGILAVGAFVSFAVHDVVYAAALAGVSIVVLVLAWRPELNPGQATWYERRDSTTDEPRKDP